MVFVQRRSWILVLLWLRDIIIPTDLYTVGRISKGWVNRVGNPDVNPGCLQWLDMIDVPSPGRRISSNRTYTGALYSSISLYMELSVLLVALVQGVQVPPCIEYFYYSLCSFYPVW